MLKKPLFASLLSVCKSTWVEKRTYKKGEAVIDHISDHNIYIFSEGWYTVSSLSLLGWVHEVGEIESPSMIGEWVFFWAFKKPVKIVCETDHGEVYILSEKTIGTISKENEKFHEILMRSCLAVTNERIGEANIERTIWYTLVDALENKTFGTIPALLATLKKTFSLSDTLWIERHEVLHDIFSLRFRESSGSLMINERIQNLIVSSWYTTEKWLFGDGYAHIFPFESQGERYGYLIYMTASPRLSGYIRRITLDMVPNCIRIIESGWKSRNTGNL